jgi:hypothetical protein
MLRESELKTRFHERLVRRAGFGWPGARAWDNCSERVRVRRSEHVDIYILKCSPK